MDEKNMNYETSKRLCTLLDGESRLFVWSGDFVYFLEAFQDVDLELPYFFGH